MINVISMEFLSLIRRRSFARNVPSGKERGETDVKKKEETDVKYVEKCNLQKVCESSDSLYGNRYIFLDSLCTGQIEASTCPPPGIPRAFDTFAVPRRREFDYQSLPGGGEFDPHALGVGNLNCTLDFM